MNANMNTDPLPAAADDRPKYRRQRPIDVASVRRLRFNPA
jgi:hypothetical protein